jgi:putative (di)nucleoside polyphosphate hydrolase
VLINPTGEVFAGQRIDNPGPAWQMPQGGVDKGEEPAVAALRELREETGVAPARVQILRESADWIPYDLPRDLAPRLWKGRYRGQKQKWFAMRFLGEDSDIDISGPEPEFSRWSWMRPSLLIERIVPFKRPTYERVFSEFADLLD